MFRAAASPTSIAPPARRLRRGRGATDCSPRCAARRRRTTAPTATRPRRCTATTSTSSRRRPRRSPTCATSTRGRSTSRLPRSMRSCSNAAAMASGWRWLGSRTTPSSATCRRPRSSSATARSTGSASRASTPAPCFAALLGDPEQRPLAASRRAAAARRHAATATTRSCSRRRGRPTRASCACIDFMPPRGQGAGRRPHRRGRARPRRDAVGARHRASTTGTSSRGCAASSGGTRSRYRRTGCAVLPNARAHTRREHAHDLDVHGRGRASACRSSSHGSRRTSSSREPIDPEQALADTHEFWTDWSGSCPADAPGRVARRSQAFAHRAQGAHVRADGRHRRGADDVAAGVDRRRSQLGLPLLLAARRDTDAPARSSHADYADEAKAWRAWLLRAVAGVSSRHPDHVRRRRRAASHGARASVAQRLRRLRSRPGRQRRERAAPDRRLRRDHGCPVPGARARSSRSRSPRGHCR